MIEYIDLKKWKKMKVIIYELHSEFGINISKDGREWREAVKKWNQKWQFGEVPFYITHSNVLGYKATTDFNEGMIGINDYISRCKNLNKQIKAGIEGFQRKDNCKYNFEKGEIL